MKWCKPLCDDLTVYGRDQAEGADKEVGVVTWIKSGLPRHTDVAAGVSAGPCHECTRSDRASGAGAGQLNARLCYQTRFFWAQGRPDSGVIHLTYAN